MKQFTDEEEFLILSLVDGFINDNLNAMDNSKGMTKIWYEKTIPRYQALKKKVLEVFELLEIEVEEGHTSFVKKSDLIDLN